MKKSILSSTLGSARPARDDHRRRTLQTAISFVAGVAFTIAARLAVDVFSAEEAATSSSVPEDQHAESNISDDSEHQPPEAAPLVGGRKRRPLVRPDGLYVATDPEREREYREQQSVDLINVFLRRLDLVASTIPDRNPEAAVSAHRLYETGFVDALLRAAPDLTNELSERVEQTLCDPQSKDTQIMSMTHLISDIPELASEHGFDCVFSRKQKEDSVLWFALDAWRAAKLPRSPALDHLAQTATDERTRSRLSGKDPGLSEIDAPTSQLVNAGTSEADVSATLNSAVPD